MKSSLLMLEDLLIRSLMTFMVEEKELSHFQKFPSMPSRGASMLMCILSVIFTLCKVLIVAILSFFTIRLAS